MSRKLSLMTIALCAALIAAPAMAQQPSGGKDSTAAPSMAKKGHKGHHKKGAAATKDTTMSKKDTTKK
ncbi:MAG TPA: hypothetical protein VE091_15655 [Gemmatimonadales bacterium]|jgi:uncharacterized protein YdeI (BOF family)|nr:hypothetical protein [Gemmatimonadales bacterium]